MNVFEGDFSFPAGRFAIVAAGLSKKKRRELGIEV